MRVTLILVAVSALFVGCGKRAPPRMPEPSYETPHLPDWQAPADPTNEFDPDQLDGQWADDGQGPGGAPPRE